MILIETNKKPIMNFMMTGRLRTPHWAVIFEVGFRQALAKLNVSSLTSYPNPEPRPYPCIWV